METEVAANRPWPASDSSFLRSLAPELQSLFGAPAPIAATRPLIVLPRVFHGLVLPCEAEALGDDTSSPSSSSSPASLSLNAPWIQYLRSPLQDEKVVASSHDGAAFFSSFDAKERSKTLMSRPRDTRETTTRHGMRSLGMKIDMPTDSYLQCALGEALWL
jgi:hypothetical protein